MKKVALLFLLGKGITTFSQAVIYPSPKGLEPSTEYKVKVNEKEAFVYASPVPAAYCSFDITGEVDIVIKANRDIKWVDIRPLSLGIKPIFKDSIISFHLTKAVKISIELNGSIKTPLLIFANAPELEKPGRNDPGVLFFEAGKIHHAGLIVLKSNQTVYIEGGAVVTGAIMADNAKNISIKGHGILDGTWNNRFSDSLIKLGQFGDLPKESRAVYQRFIQLNNCENVHIEGVTLHNSTSWQVVPINCRKVTIDNIKIVSDQPSDDGVDIVHCKDLVIKNCFIRTKDDCVVVKAYLEDEKAQPVDNILVENSVFWNALWGNALEIGFELNGVDVKNITIKNCDIIHVEAGAVISIHNAGKSTVSNVIFDDIRIEDARQKLFDFAIFRSQYSDDSPRDNEEKHKLYLNGAWDGVLMVPTEKKGYHAQFRGSIKNIQIKNVKLIDGLFPYSIFYGFDSAHLVDNVVVENLFVHGKKLNTIEEAKFYLENTARISIK